MTSSSTALASVLAQEIQQLQAFLDILSAEQSLLADGAHDLDALAASTAAKQDCASALETTQRERAAVLLSLGQTNDRAGLLAAATESALSTQAETLLELTAQAAGLNTDNGAALDIYQQHAQLALTELQSLIAGTRLYDAQGRTRAQAGKLVGRS